jgi:hypothetical protein
MLLGKTVAATSFREMLSKVADDSRVTLSGSVWTKVGEFKAIKQPKYSLTVPTLFDSTIVEGQKLTTFDVVGYTAANVVYASAAATGYSLDNLAPTVPTGLALQSIAGAVNISWESSTDADFKYFAVYRGVAPNFNAHGTPLATTSGAQYADASIQLGRTYYYKLTAFDFSGNESNFTDEKSIMVTSIEEGNGIPIEFALRQNHPNPFNPTTSIRYELPQAAHVKISIYNSLGMLVTTLVDQDEQSGYHTIEWNGTDNSGNTIASGIYIYKMEAGTFSSIKKMLFIK